MFKKFNTHRIVLQTSIRKSFGCKCSIEEFQVINLSITIIVPT